MAEVCSHMATAVHSNAWTGAYRPLNRQTSEIKAINIHQSNLVKSVIGKVYLFELLEKFQSSRMKSQLKYLFVSPIITGEQV